MGATLVDFTWNGQLPKKKNWALANVPWRHEWVFILDADERITPELAAELGRIVAAPGREGYDVNRRFWFLDAAAALRISSQLEPTFLSASPRPVRTFAGLGDTSSGDNEIHEHVILDGRTGRLGAEMEHLAFPCHRGLG
jgi:hypothetical protein